MKVYNEVIEVIKRDILSSQQMCATASLAAMENIHDFVEEWIDVLQDDVDREAAEGGEG